LKAVLTMAHDVFISHASVDKVAADAVCAALEAKGIRCWIAPRDIKPSQSWAVAIVEAIREARVFLLVFSRNSNESEQVQREVERAANSRKQLLTLRIEDVSPAAALEYYLNTPHWLDAITPPFEAHLDKLADACAGVLTWLDSGQDASDDNPAGAPTKRTASRVAPQFMGGQPPAGWWRRQRQSVKAVLIGAVVVVVAAIAATAGQLLGAARQGTAPPSVASGPPVTTLMAPAPAPAPGPAPAGSTDPRAQIVQITGAWSFDGFVDAIVGRDTRVVALYLQSGLKATTLTNGASAILFGFQGVSQNGDPVELVKTFQAGGFKVDDELHDGYLLPKIGLNPVIFDSPLAPKGYEGGMGGTFVGTLLFWIVERASWNGVSDQDSPVIDYLISQGADCKVPLAFLDTVSYLSDSDVYTKMHPVLESCGK
jgi:hypothetical protein